jgi:iron complex outermembrane receptor protein
VSWLTESSPSEDDRSGREARAAGRPFRCLPALTLISFFSASEAAALYEGKLRLSDGQPAARYHVSVVGLPLAATCDGEGRFRFDPAPTPPFTLVAVSPAGEVSPPLAVETLSAELRLPAVVREALTVVAGVAPSLEPLAGSAAIVLTPGSIAERAPQRLHQVLESVAGASRLGDGADSVPALRNLGRGRTLLLIDGARVTAERRAGPSATFLEPASLASVDVLRGPASVVYGSDAFGGVLNAVTRDPEPGGAVRYSVAGGFGALPESAAAAAGSIGRGAAGLLVEAHGRDADDARAGGGGAIFNSSYTSYGGGLRWVLDRDHGRLRASLAIDRVEDLGKAAIDSRAIRAIYPVERSDRLTISWLGSPSGGWDSSDAALFLGRYRIVLDRDRAATSTSNRRIDSSDTAADDASLRLSAGRPVAGGRLQLGLDAVSRHGLQAIVSQRRFAADGATLTGFDRSPAIADARQVDGGAFATFTRPIAPRWSLGLGARGDRISTRNQGGHFGNRSLSHSALSGNLAITAGPFAGWTTTMQAARGFRSPTLSDRYFRGPSGRGFVIGNPHLDPETSLQWDLTSRWQRPGTTLGVFAYRYRIDDLVERYASGADFLFRNRGRALIEGLELELQSALSEAWSIEAGAAVSRGHTDGGAAIDDIAPQNGWLTARYGRGRADGFARLTGVRAHRDPGPTELERPGYALVDVGGGWRLSDRLELRLTVRNAGDRRYYAAPDNAADRASGRSVALAVSGKL